MASFRAPSVQRAAVCFAAVLIVLLFWLTLPPRFAANQSSDYVYYYEPLARHLLAGGGLTFEKGGVLATSNPPGFTLLLAGIFWLAEKTGFSELFLSSALTLMFIGGAAVLLFQIGLETWNGSAEGWVAALFFATYPFFLWLTKQPATEIPFMFFLYAALYAFQRGLRTERNPKRIFFFAGVLAGAAMLIRAAAFGIGSLFAALIFILKRGKPWKRRVAFALALLAGNLLAIAPWETAVYSQSGKWILLGENGAPSVRDGLTFAVLKSYRQSFNLPPDVVNLQKTYAQQLDARSSLAEIAAVVWEQAKAQPAASFKLALIKALRCWYGTDSGQMETPILFVQIFYAALLIFAVWRERAKLKTAPLVWAVAALTAYFWGVAALALSILRYTVPVIGLFGLILAPAARGFFQNQRIWKLPSSL